MKVAARDSFAHKHLPAQFALTYRHVSPTLPLPPTQFKASEVSLAQTPHERSQLRKQEENKKESEVNAERTLKALPSSSSNALLHSFQGGSRASALPGPSEETEQKCRACKFLPRNLQSLSPKHPCKFHDTCINSSLGSGTASQTKEHSLQSHNP